MKAKSEPGRNVGTLAEMTSGGPILDIVGEEIDPIWAAGFRGFFWGEGTLGMTARLGNPKVNPLIKWVRHSIAVTASIGLRSDDSALLVEFQRRLGGRLRTEPYRGADSRKTITRWTVGTAQQNVRIGRLLESPTELPFSKARQLSVWRRAVETKVRAGAHSGARYSDEDHAYMVWAAAELQRLRRWAG